MGIFDWLERQAGDSKLAPDWRKLGNVGYDAFDYGKGLTDEGLTGLRSLDQTYQDRLKDPLGSVGRGIFARARGTLSDDAVRRQRADSARIFQTALQSGGTLSPEAQAELQQRNQRDINESLFSGETDLAGKEALMTLDETGKLFDRMEGIRKTLVGVGQDERTRALQTIIASLSGRTGRMKAIWDDVTGTIHGGYGGK